MEINPTERERERERGNESETWKISRIDSTEMIRTFLLLDARKIACFRPLALPRMAARFRFLPVAKLRRSMDGSDKV